MLVPALGSVFDAFLSLLLAASQRAEMGALGGMRLSVTSCLMVSPMARCRI